MSLTNTILKVGLPSGNIGVYEVQPHYLNLQGPPHYEPLSRIAVNFGVLLARKKDGCWLRESSQVPLTDPRLIKILEEMKIELEPVV